MIVNPSKLIDGLMHVFQLNEALINTVVGLYQKGRTLKLLKGERKQIANSNFPVLEFEPVSSDASWFACRVQRGDFEVKLVLSVLNGDEDKSVEFIGVLTTMVGRILMWPTTIQRRIPGTDFYLVDSGVKGLQYSTIRQGSVRQAEFTWYGWVIEHFDNRVFDTGGEGITGSPPDAMVVPQSGAL